jgi:uncharacterized protein (DUF1697 family)
MNLNSANMTMSSQEAQVQLEKRLKEVLEQRESTQVRFCRLSRSSSWKHLAANEVMPLK